MGWTLAFSPESLIDLESIVTYIAEDNPERAESFGYELIEQTDILEHFPESGRIVPEFKDTTVRELIHGAYRIVYRIQHTSSQVEILRFWHCSRDIPQL